MRTTESWSRARSRVLVIGLAIAWAAASCGGPAPVANPAAPASSNRVTTAFGVVEGAITPAGVRTFFGIPFAAPPVGELRWRPPQPPARWDGVRPATAFGPAPPQLYSPMIGKQADNQAEDCLYLNVWAPAAAATERLPVIVYIHGGAFVAGWTSEPLLDGTALASRGVVFVSIGYRVGALGFLAHPALTREGGGSSGNYGLLDQIAGLAWVRDNIAAFGGDPRNVTLFGNSAGGKAVSLLATSPRTRGMFHRLIALSGGAFSAPKVAQEPGLQVRPLRVAEAVGERYFASLGISELAVARTRPVAELIAPEVDWGPVFDGDVLPGVPHELYEAGRFHDTPILIGTNSDDGAQFAKAGITPEGFTAMLRGHFGPAAEPLLAAYPHATTPEALRASQELARDGLFGWHTWTWARLQTTHGKSPAFVYYFDRRSPDFPAGPAHGGELAYVFGTFAHSRWSDKDPVNLTIASRIQAYWINFARTGSPNGDALPTWEPFSPARPEVLVIDTEGAHMAPLPRPRELEAFDVYYAWRRAAYQSTVMP